MDAQTRARVVYRALLGVLIAGALGACAAPLVIGRPAKAPVGFTTAPGAANVVRAEPTVPLSTVEARALAAATATHLAAPRPTATTRPTASPAPTLAPTAAPTAARQPTAAQVVVTAVPPPREVYEGRFAYGAAIADVSVAPDRSYALARRTGFTHAYAIVDWNNVLREDANHPGRYAWERGEANDLDNVLTAARAHGLALVIRLDRPRHWPHGSLSRLDPAVMERFAYGVAARAKDVATAYEVLNEPNLPYEWVGSPDPIGYARLLAAAQRGIKRADPGAVVIAAGLSPYTGGLGGTIEDVDFLRALYAAGARGTFDALGAHAYAGDRAPELDPWSCGMCFRRVERYRRVMEEVGDGGTPIWITEFGYLHTTSLALGGYDWMKVSAETQGERIAAAYRYARGHWPWLRGMVLFNLDFSTVPWNPAPSAPHWFSLLNADRSARPALNSVSAYLGAAPP